MSNKIQKNKIKDFFNKLKFRKIDQYAVVEQTIPVFYFMMMAIFIETRWASNLIGFISYMICSLVIIVGYVCVGVKLLKFLDNKYKKWPFLIPYLCGGFSMILGAIAFIIAKYGLKELALIFIYGYMYTFLIDLILYLFPGCLLGTYTSYFKEKKISNFYTLFSRNPIYFNEDMLARILTDQVKTDIFLKQSDDKNEKIGKNIISNLRTLRNIDIDNFIKLKSEIIARANTNIFSMISLFISVVSLFVFRYYSNIISVFTKLLIGKKVELWKSLISGFGLGFMCLVVIGALVAFNKESEEKKFKKMEEYIKYAEKDKI